MNYNDLHLDEPILSKEQAENSGKRFENKEKAPDLSEDFQRGINNGKKLIEVLGNIGKPSAKTDLKLDKETVSKLEDVAKKVAPSEETQEKLKENAKVALKCAEDLGGKAKDLVKDQIDVDNYTTDALALLFLALESMPPLVFLVVNKVIPLLNIVLSFFVLIAVAVILVCYLIIKKYKESLKNSTSAIVIEIIMCITEGIIIVCFSVTGVDAFIAAYMILSVSLLSAAILANELKKKYTSTNGIRMAIIMVVNMVFVLFNVLNNNLIECGIAALITYLYLAFAITNLYDIVKELDEPNSKKAASYATLIVYERKVEIIYRSIVWVIRKIQDLNEKRKQLKAENSAKEPLLDKSDKKKDNNDSKEQPKDQKKPEEKSGKADKEQKVSDEKPEKESKKEKK